MKEKLDINEHAYVILVPLSEEAQERMDQYDIYDNGEVAECFKSMVFGLETEEYMEVRLFDLINAKLDILINIYEEEIRDAEPVTYMLALTLSKNEETGSWYVSAVQSYDSSIAGTGAPATDTDTTATEVSTDTEAATEALSEETSGQ